jgi:transmembrane sensor
VSTVRLRDGSSATPLDAGSVLTTVEDSPRHTLIELQRGRARLDVVPSATRVFSVNAGDVTITVLGTVFTVERIADRVNVTVERGSVRVDWGAGDKVLHLGESGWFPPLAVEARLETATTSNAHLSGGKRAPARADAVVAVASAEAAIAPDPPAGAAAPSGPPPTVATTDSAGELLAAADVARLQGHAEEGAVILRRLLRDHESDPRAPLAAFTLGRVLMIELGQPREAAAAFARARVLDPGGPFAEDALARETEAWALAGDRDLARDRAAEYLRSYPRGRRVDSVKALGGID